MRKGKSFGNEEDCLRFLDILGKMIERFKLELHAYVLMKNHVILLRLGPEEQVAGVGAGIAWQVMNELRIFLKEVAYHLSGSSSAISGMLH